MAKRILLRLLTDPGEAQVFCNLQRKDGYDEKLIATVDTGAGTSLFPIELLEIIEHQRVTLSSSRQGLRVNRFKLLKR